jgi:hypothetical protein
VSEKRKRTTTVLCTDDVWSRFQDVAAKQGKTLAVLLGEVVESETARAPLSEQARLPDVAEGETTGIARRSVPARTLIGFGEPIVRIL